jgi:hypothetical protein
VERQFELEDIRHALELLRERQAVEPLNAAQQRLHDSLIQREWELLATPDLDRAGAT